jgi:hypothetical protein
MTVHQIGIPPRIDNLFGINIILINLFIIIIEDIFRFFLANFIK